jgi:hypothetical protein
VLAAEPLRHGLGNARHQRNVARGHGRYRWLRLAGEPAGALCL